jgi:hypothetical protein
MSEVIWNACMHDQSASIRWIECHPATVSALQDILLLITIIVAIAIPLITEARARQLRRTERRSSSEAFAAGLLAPTSQMTRDFARVLHQINVFEGTHQNNPGIPDLLRQARVIVPPQIYSAMERMHEFDNEVVGRLRTAFTGVIGYNNFLDDLVLAAVDDLNRIENVRPILVAKTRAMATQIRGVLQGVTGLNDVATNTMQKKDSPSE